MLLWFNWPPFSKNLICIHQTKNKPISVGFAKLNEINFKMPEFHGRNDDKGELCIHDVE